jgi:transcriptional regulator with GAF, ATPase, and Fis domain
MKALFCYCDDKHGLYAIAKEINNPIEDLNLSWQEAKSVAHGGDPTASCIKDFLSNNDSAVIIVPEIVLCDFYNYNKSMDNNEVKTAFLRCRQELFHLNLRKVIPLYSSQAPYLKKSFVEIATLLVYEKKSDNKVDFFDPMVLNYEKLANVQKRNSLQREDINAEKRLDSWYYKVDFVEIRKKISDNSRNYIEISQIMTPNTPLSNSHQFPLGHAENNGDNLKYVSSGQIDEVFNVIIPQRIKYNAKPECKSMQENEVYFSLGSASDVQIKFCLSQISKYSKYSPSLYLGGATLKNQWENYAQQAYLWAEMSLDFFKKQISMELSDRMMMPLYKRFPWENACIQKKGIITSHWYVFLFAFLELFVNSDMRGYAIKNIEKYLDNINKDDYLIPIIKRRIDILSDELDSKKITIIYSNLPKEDLEVFKDKLQSNDIYEIPIKDKLSRKDLVELKNSAMCYMLTNASNPIQSVNERIFFSHAIDIVGLRHCIIGVGKDTAGNDRQKWASLFIDSIFSESENQIIYKKMENLTADLDDEVKKISTIPYNASDVWRELLKNIHKLLLKSIDKLDADVCCLINRFAAKFNLAKYNSDANYWLDNKNHYVWNTFGAFATVDQQLAQEIKSLDIRIKNIVSRMKGIQTGVFTLLIEGETGTGKNLLAQYIFDRYRHWCEMSNVKSHDALSDTPQMVSYLDGDLLFAQLFGAEKGSYTGCPPKGKPGVIEEANKNGFIILDEINSYDYKFQDKFLRFLQDGTYVKLGGTKENKFTGLVVALSNEKLSELVKQEKRFRKDLVYRLGIPFRIPPLRERPDDIDGLINKISSNLFFQHHESIKLSYESKKLLKNYNWPGNARQLSMLLHNLSLFLTEEERENIDVKKIEHYFPEISNNDLIAEPDTLPQVSDLKCQNDILLYELKALNDELCNNAKKGDAWNCFQARRGNNHAGTNNLAKYIKDRKCVIIENKEILPKLFEYFSNSN